MAHFIMLVDDDNEYLELGKMYLESDGENEVDTFSSTGNAINALDSDEYDVIISDYEMPDISGIEFLKYMRAKGIDTPFIVLTGRGDEKAAMEALNNGADFYIQKHPDPRRSFSDLRLKINEAIAKKEEQVSIRKTAENLADILDFLPVPIFAIDRSGHVLLWNNTMEFLTSVKAEEVIGRGNFEYALPFTGSRQPLLIDIVLSFDLVHSNIDISLPGYDSIEREGNIFFAESEFSRADGSKFFILEKASPLYDQNGNAIGAIEAIRDITRQKNLERLLIENTNRLELALQCTEQGFWDYNLETGEICIEPVSSNEMPATAERLTFREWTRRIHPDDYPSARNALNEYLKRPESMFSAEYRIRTGPDKWKWIVSRGKITAFDKNGRPARMVGTNQALKIKSDH